MPRSRRAGSWRAASGKCGISRKYTTFPAKTAISDWTKFTMPGFDTGKPEKEQSALSIQPTPQARNLSHRFHELARIESSIRKNRYAKSVQSMAALDLAECSVLNAECSFNISEMLEPST